MFVIGVILAFVTAVFLGITHFYNRKMKELHFAVIQINYAGFGLLTMVASVVIDIFRPTFEPLDYSSA